MEPPDEVDEFDDGEPLTPASPGRARRAARIAVLVVLILSMVVLAFVSGRGIVVVPPAVTATLTPPATAAIADRSMLAAVDGAGHLATMDALGGSIAGYGPPDVAFTFPAWSPDGTRVAAVGQSAAATGIYVFTVAREGAPATAPTVIYQSAASTPFYLYWSPDGGRITFLTTEPNSVALRVAPADASAPATAIRFGSQLYWAWADPTHLIAHTGGEGNGSFFGEIGLDGTSLEPAPIAAGRFQAPAISSNGKFRAYVTPGGPAPEQVVVEARDGSARHTVGVFGAAALGFAPRAGTLAFIAPAVAGAPANVPLGPLRLVDAASGAVSTLLADSVVAFAWSPDGSTIAALEVPGPSNDTVASVGRVRLVAAAAPAPGTPLRMAFVNTVTGAIRAQGSVRVSDLFVQQVLPFFDQYALSHRTWSSDSTSIALPTVAGDGTSQLSIIRTDGVTAGTLPNEVAGSWRP